MSNRCKIICTCDEYEVAIFVMKEDGTPFHRAAATPRTVQIDGNYNQEYISSMNAVLHKKIKLFGYFCGMAELYCFMSYKSN